MPTQEPDTTDWTLLEKVKRDICFLYHELAEYSGIMGDLSYAHIYTLPYWDFVDLQIPRLHETDRRFIRDGCLIMILAMAWDVIDGSGSYLQDKYAVCRAAIERVKAEDERTAVLLQTATLALDAAEQGRRRDSVLVELAIWANREYVQGYFRSALKETLSRNIGMAKGSFATASEVDAFIRQERDTWDS